MIYLGAKYSYLICLTIIRYYTDIVVLARVSSSILKVRFSNSEGQEGEGRNTWATELTSYMMCTAQIFERTRFLLIVS